MKRFSSLVFWSLLLFAMAGSSSCGEKYKKDYSAPGPVTDASAINGYGRITLKWKAPQDPIYHYTRIEYTDPVSGKTTWVYADKFDQAPDGYTSKIIGGYVDAGDHEFTLTAHGFTFGVSEPVTIEGKNLGSAFDNVATTLAIAPDIRGALVQWTNTSGSPVIVRAVFTDTSGNEQTTELLSDAEEGVMRIGTIGSTPQDIRVAVLDETGMNSSEITTFQDVVAGSGTPETLPKTGWAIVEVNNEWPEGPQWAAANLFDGNPATSWHTTPGTLYPFHATIDLQEPMVITSVELTGRSVQPPQVEGPDRVGFELSADGENWVKAGSFAFNRQDPFSVQSYDIFQAQYEVRYLKLILLEGPSPYSYMGEVNVKGKLR